MLGIGQERFERIRVVGIVEDQEPAGLGRQPLLEGEDGLVQVVLRVREMHPPGELAAAGLQGERRFRIEPEDGLVLRRDSGRRIRRPSGSCRCRPGR